MKIERSLVLSAATVVALLANQSPSWSQTSDMGAVPVPTQAQAATPNAVPANISIPSSTDKLQLPELTPDEQKLFELVQESEYSEAKQHIQSHLDKTRSRENLERMQQLAYVEMRMNEHAAAIKELQDTLPSAGEKADTHSTREQVQILRRIGDIYLQMRKKESAIDTYKTALFAAKGLDPSDPLITGILEPLVGTLVQDGQSKEALPYAEQMVAGYEQRAKSGELIDVAGLFWAYVHAGQIYREVDPSMMQKNFARAMPLLDQLLELRNKFTANIYTPEEAEANAIELQKGMLRSYIAINKPASLSDYLFMTSQFRARVLPLINWPAANNMPKAAILCVHGLGLENRAFTPFGKVMATKNFVVYAMDVRGFGAFQSEYGSESVDFTRALKDIRLLLKVIKTKHPDIPVFLCGESMGGAIVLRAASEYGSEIDGIISSVPSAERYGSRRMAAQVALHLLRSPNKPFNIGKQIEAQATSKENLRELWKKDPKAKGSLSPVELIKFDMFMKETKKKCGDIRKTPVLVVQGLADQLVKPQGTYEMFDNVNSPDKSMLIIGDAEHLILETPKQSKVLLDGLASWLDNHLVPKPQEAAGSAPVRKDRF